MTGRVCRKIVLLAILFALPGFAVQAEINIQKVKSRGGIEAWLVEDHDIPLIAVNVAFRGGSATDPADKSGLATMVSGLLDEGAGNIRSEEFQRRLQDASIELSFSASRDDVGGSLRTLTKNRDEAFHLMGLAFAKPRFDAKPVQRVRSQLLARIARNQEQPRRIAAKAWYKLAFGDHPYGMAQDGTPETVKAIGETDLHNFARGHFTRDNLVVSVVGDIDPAALRRLLDKTFGDLPETSTIREPADVTASPEPGLHIIRTSSPQSVVIFGHKGIKRRDPDWYVAYVMNYILGGGALTSRLADEVREKRGLAYSVYTYFNPLDHAGLFMGYVGTQNARVGESISLITREIKKIRDQGVTEDELKNAITYLTGSYPLSFDSSRDIAGQLTGIQLEGFDPDYVNRRNGYIRSVTLPQIKRVAKRLLDPKALSWVIVGNPQGLEKGTSAAGQ